jgi:hypothetical protein
LDISCWKYNRWWEEWNFPEVLHESNIHGYVLRSRSIASLMRDPKLLQVYSCKQIWSGSGIVSSAVIATWILYEYVILLRLSMNPSVTFSPR